MIKLWGFLKKSANQLLDSIDKNELFQSGVDELVNLMFKKVLVNLLMERSVFRNAVRANVEHIVSQFPLDLKSQTQTIDDVADFGDFLNGIENRLVKKVSRQINNFKPTESPEQSLRNEDSSYMDLYNHKKRHLLALLAEQSPFMDPIKHASYSEICEGLTDDDIVLKSFDELRKMVNEKYKTFQSDSRKAVRLNLTSTKPQSSASSSSQASSSSSSQASSSYEARSSLSGKKIIGTFRPMRDLYYSKGESVGDKYWIAAKNAFAELLLKPNAKKIEEGAPAIRDGNLLASYLHDLIETLPNDKIRTQDDLKAALKKIIIDCKTKEERLDVNLFKQFARSNLSNIRNTPEYDNAIADLRNNQWPEGEERTFTFTQFDPKKLEDIVGSNGVVDTFFNHMYTTVLLKRFWNLDK
jgi:hypothetical protein